MLSPMEIPARFARRSWSPKFQNSLVESMPSMPLRVCSSEEKSSRLYVNKTGAFMHIGDYNLIVLQGSLCKYCVSDGLRVLIVVIMRGLLQGWVTKSGERLE